MANRSEIRTQSPAGLSKGQRLIALCLLLIVAFLVVNPICECHDHMDNLRHLSSHGFLMILLLLACAGIALTKALKWLGLQVLRVVLFRPPFLFLVGQRCDVFCDLFRDSLALPLRV